MRAPRLQHYATHAACVAVSLGLGLLGDPIATSAASPSGSEFQVNTYTTGEQATPTVASDSKGTFVVVWDSAGSAGSDTDNFSVQGQRYLPEPSFTVSFAAALAALIALVRRRPI